MSESKAYNADVPRHRARRAGGVNPNATDLWRVAREVATYDELRSTLAAAVALLTRQDSLNQAGGTPQEMAVEGRHLMLAVAAFLDEVENDTEPGSTSQPTTCPTCDSPDPRVHVCQHVPCPDAFHDETGAT